MVEAFQPGLMGTMLLNRAHRFGGQASKSLAALAKSKHPASNKGGDRHPDAQDPEGRRVREERTERMNLANGATQKALQGL